MRRIWGLRLLPSSKTQAPEPKSTWASWSGSHSILLKGNGVAAPSLQTNLFTVWQDLKYENGFTGSYSSCAGQ